MSAAPLAAQGASSLPAGELRALIDEAASGAPRRLTIEEISGRVSRLGLTRRNEAAPLVREGALGAEFVTLGDQLARARLASRGL